MANEINLQKNINKQLELLPHYITEWYQSKVFAGRSKRTLYEYLNEFRRFFMWLIDSDIAHVSTTRDIPLDLLENLSKNNAEAYFIYLRERNLLNTTQSKSRSMSEVTIQRTYRALSGLFKYLTEQTENGHGEPYFHRNVMKKLELKIKQKETLAARSRRIKSKLFLGDDTEALLQFISDDVSSEGYVKKANLSNRAKSSYHKNKERDLAFIALMLASGLRLSETVNIDMSDINLNTMTVEVTRKGNKRDSVHIAPFAKPYLTQYLKIRPSRYKVDIEDNKLPLFLSTQSGIAKRMGGAAMERTVAKYSEVFKTRITPHKLRHTLATRLYQATNNEVTTAQQLGHVNTALVSLYAHVLDEQVKDGLSEL